jgi:hypothetical protein
MKNRGANKKSTSTIEKPFRLRFGTITPGIAIVAILAVSGIAAACGGGGGGGGGGGLTNNCSARGPVDALQIPLAVPQTTAPAGSNISASVQVEIIGYSSGDYGTLVHFPSVYAKIPLNATTKFAFYFAPTNVTITGSGWSSPITKNGTLGSLTNFDGGAVSATLSTVSIAVMQQDQWGIVSIAGWQKDTADNLTVGVRWGWSLTVSGSTSSLWSTPTASATSPNLPSIFQPAPYVGLDGTTNTTAAIAGSTFGAKITGAVGRTSFGVSIEYPNGTEIVCQEQINHRWTHCLVVHVPLTYLNGTPLAPGHYIVHIHDSIGAIVHTISVTVVASAHGSHNGDSYGLSCSCHGQGWGWGHGGRHGGW